MGITSAQDLAAGVDLLGQDLSQRSTTMPECDNIRGCHYIDVVGRRNVFRSTTIEEAWLRVLHGWKESPNSWYAKPDMRLLARQAVGRRTEKREEEPETNNEVTKVVEEEC